MYEYLTGSLILLGIWVVVYSRLKEGSKNEMRWASLITTPLALLEPVFVPEYWNPPTLFDLARTTGFDIESFIFCFAVGGLAAVLYEAVFPSEHVRIPKVKRRTHKYHLWALLSGPLVFGSIYFTTDINPIYSASMGMLAGALGAVWCRRDLTRKILFGGASFLTLYFFFFIFFVWMFPDYVESVWNLSKLTGILMFQIPIEELLYALTQGMYWSSLYEHIFWFRLRR